MDWHTVVAISRVGYEYTSEEMEMDEALLLLLMKPILNKFQIMARSKKTT